MEKTHSEVSEKLGCSDGSKVPNIAEEAYENLLGSMKPVEELILIAPMQVPEPFFDPEVAQKSGYFNYPPVGLLYIAAVARKIKPNIEIHLLDLNFEMLKNANKNSGSFSYGFWENRLLEVIKNCKNPLIGISCMFDVNKETFVEISQFIHDHFPGAPLIGGGVQATYDYKELLSEHGFNMVFRKESEEQFSVFLANLLLDNGSAKPCGVAFSYEGEIHTLGEPSGEVPVDIDIRDVYSLIPIEDYYNYGGLAVFSRYNGKEKPFATVLTNRGCRAYCTFCTVRDFNGKGVRARDVESVIDELKFLREKGVKQIDWLDDDLLWDRSRTLHLLKRMTEELPDMEWISNNGLIAAAIDEDLMEWMVRSGLKALKVGIESGNDSMLKKIKKPTSKRKLMMASALFRKFPTVFYSGNFIVGFPEETFGEMMDSYTFARTLKWDWASFYIFQPLVGTEIYSVFKDLGDDLLKLDNANKALNPGRLAERGEFGKNFNKNEKGMAFGRDIFSLPRDLVPDHKQLNEIWFTFNFETNFVNNPNFESGGNVEKLARWFHSIFAGYPHDASMAAALAKCYRLMNDGGNEKKYSQKTEDIINSSDYWKNRLNEFPEILEMAGI